jgi:hypothetical protein
MTADVAGEFPEDGVGVKPPVAVPVGADLDAPVVGKLIPAFPEFLKRAVTHRSFSLEIPLIPRRRAGRPGRAGVLPAFFIKLK